MVSRPPRSGAPGWQPLLLREPSAIRKTRREWAPVLVRGGMITTLGLLIVFLTLQFLIPARLVLGGLGGAGRPSVAIGMLLAFLWVVSAIRSGHLPQGRQPIRWAIGIFVLAQVVGYTVGFDRLPTPGQASAADRWLILVVGFAGVCLAVTDGIVDRRDVDRLLQALVAFACLMSMAGVLQFFGVVDVTEYIRLPGLQLNYDLIGVSARGDGGTVRVAGTANHYIEFGVVLALVLPVALHYALFPPAGSTRWWRWAAVVLVALGIPLSISRSAVLSVAVAIALMAVVWPWRQRYNAAVIAVLATLVFHLLNRGVLGTIMALFTNLENDPSVTARVERTATVTRLWEQRPVLGWGAGMVTPDEFLLLDNQIYGFLIAGGVVGVLAFLVLFGIPYFLGRSIRLRGSDQETRHLGQALAVTMPTAVVASGTFDSFAFATFVGVTAVLIGATGALWRLDGVTVLRPLQSAGPEDKFVTTPLMTQLRARLREQWPARKARH